MALTISRPSTLSGSAKYESITALKAATSLDDGDFVETNAYSDNELQGSAIYQISSAPALPNDQDIIELSSGQFAVLKSKEVTPFMFGAKENDANYTENLQAFFDYVEANDVKGIYAGNWFVDETIFIKGEDKTFYCGNIHTASGLDNVVKITTGKSIFLGEMGVFGNTLGAVTSSYSARSSINGIWMANSSGRNFYNQIYVHSFKGWGVTTIDNGSLIMNKIGFLRATNCGSGNSSVRQHSFNILGYTNNGSGGSINQTSTIEFESSIDTAMDDTAFIKINGRLHYVKTDTIDRVNNTADIFPWVDTDIADPSVTPFECDSYHGGGILVTSNDSANFEIERIDATGTGVAVASYGLYGAKIGIVQSQFSQIAVAYGNELTIGTVANPIYSEGGSYSIVQRGIANETSSEFNLIVASGPERSGLDSIGYTTPISAGNQPVRFNTPQMALTYRNVRYNHSTIQIAKNGQNSIIVSNEPSKNSVHLVKNTADIELKWNEAVNDKFGRDSFVVKVSGTGSNNEPTGAVNFTLDADDQTDGITVNGATFASFSSFTETVTIAGVFDYDNQEWRINQLTGSNNTGDTLPSTEFEETGGADITVTRNDTTVSNGDKLGGLKFKGNDTQVDEANRVGAEIWAEASGTWGPGSEARTDIVIGTRTTEAQEPIERMRIKHNGIINFSNTPVYTDDAAAGAAGLEAGDMYQTALGEPRLKQ